MVLNRKSIRLKEYDYSQNGAYFVTICTHNKEHLFGKIGDMWEPTDFGKIADECWYAIPEHYPNVELDAFIVMPNHIHGIIWIQNVGAKYFLPNDEPKNEFQKMIPGSLSAIVKGYKIGVTKWCRNIVGGKYEGRKCSAPTGIEIWQRNFYEHIIRDEDDLNRIREYIINNPVNWVQDEMNNNL